MSLRDAQLELTRQKILGAVLDLVGEQSMDRLSVPLVAKRSGVSVATIYRHFPTKDALLDAAAEEPARRGVGSWVDEWEHAPTYLRKMWENFAEHLDLVRHQVASDAGREMRNRRYEAARAWFDGWAAREGIDPVSEEGRRLIRLLLLLTSSLAFLDLHDRQGVSPAKAAEDVIWAADALAAATRSGS